MDEKDRAGYLSDIEYFSAKVKAEPSSVLFVPLAQAYLKLEHFDEAVATLTAGIDSNSDILSAKTMLAAAYLGQGKKDDAKLILTEVQVVDKRNYMANKLMGDILRSEDEVKKALVNYRNALLIAPEDRELKNLVEEMMSAAGIAAHDLEQDISLMDADDELLEQLGSELAEEVRQEVGEAELGTQEASEAEVGEAIDDIVGGKLEEEAEEMSLESYAEGEGDFSGELEEEMVASFDDDIVPTELSADSEEEPQNAVQLDAEVTEDAGGAPAEDEVQALAAELGADLGLEPGGDVSQGLDTGVSDEVDEALSHLFDGVEEDDGSTEIEPELQEMIKGDIEVEDVEIPTTSDDEIEEMLETVSAESGEIEEDPPDEAEEEVMALLSKMDEKLESGAEFASGENTNGEQGEDIEAMFAQLQQQEEASSAEAYEIAPAEAESLGAAEEVLDELSGAEPVSEADEGSEEVFEASMEELTTEGSAEEEQSENRLEDLPEETREQVNRLENLLETIKNNAGN